MSAPMFEVSAGSRNIADMRRVSRLHFIGIGGTGMSGIAELLFQQGYQVSGSDLSHNSATQHLNDLGVKVLIGHDAKNIAGAHVVVRSSAIADDNVELQAALEQHIPVVPRAVMLAELMRFHRGIAVAGSHGKTSTTSFIASIFSAAGCDPTFVVGGRINNLDSGTRSGGGYFIAEADESDASFLRLQPITAVVTNIDAEHLAYYAGNFDRLKKTYLEFLHNLPFYGLAVICADDPEVMSIRFDVGRQTITYGFSKDADYRVNDYRQEGLVSHCRVELPEARSLEFTLRIPGRHNVLNAAAAIAVADEEGIEPKFIRAGLAAFEGVARRFQIYGDFAVPGGQATLIDDYGHHPVEIEATLKAIRVSMPERRVIMIYQPHRYSRSRDLFDDFVSVLSQVDSLFVLDVHSAGEAPLVDADSRALCRGIRKRAELDPIYVEHVDKLLSVIKKEISPGDILLTQGAGSVGLVASRLARDLRAGKRAASRRAKSGTAKPKPKGKKTRS